jgi:hypothetical protein
MVYIRNKNVKGRISSPHVEGFGCFIYLAFSVAVVQAMDIIGNIFKSIKDLVSPIFSSKIYSVTTSYYSPSLLLNANELLNFIPIKFRTN